MGDNGHREIDREKKSKLAVFIVDNQPLYRQAIRQVLSEEMEVLGESALTTNVWRVIATLLPDMVLDLILD